MERFKKVAIKKHEAEMVDNLYKFEEAVKLVNRADLDLSKVNLYLHQILHLPPTVRSFRIHVNYGNIAEDGSF
jgi:hypothetical protein